MPNPSNPPPAPPPSTTTTTTTTTTTIPTALYDPSTATFILAALPLSALLRGSDGIRRFAGRLEMQGWGWERPVAWAWEGRGEGDGEQVGVGAQEWIVPEVPELDGGEIEKGNKNKRIKTHRGTNIEIIDLTTDSSSSSPTPPITPTSPRTTPCTWSFTHLLLPPGSLGGPSDCDWHRVMPGYGDIFFPPPPAPPFSPSPSPDDHPDPDQEFTHDKNILHTRLQHTLALPLCVFPPPAPGVVRILGGGQLQRLNFPLGVGEDGEAGLLRHAGEEGAILFLVSGPPGVSAAPLSPPGILALFKRLQTPVIMGGPVPAFPSPNLSPSPTSPASPAVKRSLALSLSITVQIVLHHPTGSGIATVRTTTTTKRKVSTHPYAPLLFPGYPAFGGLVDRVVGWACRECGVGVGVTALGGRWWIGAGEAEAGGDAAWIEEWEMGSAVWQVFARRGGGGGAGGAGGAQGGGMVVGGGARLGGCVYVELFEAEGDAGGV